MMDAMTLKYVVAGSCSFLVIAMIGYFWFFRLRRRIETYLTNFSNVLGSKPHVKRLLPLYAKEELSGEYKEREIVGGVQYIGLGFEWMPMPYIRIRLKPVIRYNYHRVPYFAAIENGWLVFKIRERFAWGVFDRLYHRFFTKEYLMIALSRLYAVAEDVERGKTLEEIFK